LIKTYFGISLIKEAKIDIAKSRFYRTPQRVVIARAGGGLQAQHLNGAGKLSGRAPTQPREFALPQRS